MNRRDLLKALTAIIPAPWLPKAIPQAPVITAAVGTWLAGSRSPTIDIVKLACERIAAGSFVEPLDGHRVVNARGDYGLLGGVCIHDVDAGQKCLVRIAGPVSIPECW